MNNKEKILQKLRKLMNLKESATELGNEGEAYAAAAGIRRLLIEYNLSEKDIPEKEKIQNPIISNNIPWQNSIKGRWYIDLILAISNNNMCSTIVCQTVHNGRYHKDHIEIVGRQKNIEITLYLISFLSNKFVEIGKQKYLKYKNEYRQMTGDKPLSITKYLKSFLCGCVLGLMEQFETQKKEMENNGDVKSLMVISKNEINLYLQGRNIKEKQINSKETVRKEGLIEGINTGKSININKGIHTDKQANLLKLC